jgi:uncharacterized membrane protein
MKLWLLGFVLVWLATPANAAITLCNRTSYVLYAATAAVKSPSSETKGWTRIVPGDCQQARREDLTNQNYLVYARSSLAHSGPGRSWGGNFPLCVSDTNFDLKQAVTQPYCTDSHTFALPFAPLDVEGRRSWTTTFDESPALPSLTGAQLAGVKRLLTDNGYKVGAINAKPGKETGAALSAFRTRMRFSPTAGNAELFDALETEALRTNAPAGYTVCNDTKAVFLAALGDSRGQGLSRGWWTVEPGACARTITTPLHSEAIHLLIQKGNGQALVGGPDKFCVTPQVFDIQGRNNCVKRGYQEMGFARTDTGNRTGYVAHIGEAGLVAAPGAIKQAH